MSEDGIRRRIKAEVVRRLREELSLTQEELAAKAGISRATIISYEGGAERPPSPRHVRRLADALGVNPREIVSVTFVD